MCIRDRYWPQTWTSLSQVTTVGYSAFSLAVAGVLVRGDAERLQVRMRQTPPVARYASHRPKRAERPVRSRGAVADATTGGAGPRKVRHEPIAAVRASRSAGGWDSAFGVSLAGFGAPAIRRRWWMASGAGLQAAHPRQPPRRRYLQGQHLRCRRRSPLADHLSL